MTQKLEQATKSKIDINKRLEKSKEEIDDLRFQVSSKDMIQLIRQYFRYKFQFVYFSFQLEERNIELEGTKAQLRILASKSSILIDYSTELDNCDNHLNEVSTPSMKAMIPLQMDEINTNSSSTESAHDHAERENGRVRRPSKIPLAGTKTYLAPKPPTGRKNLSKSTSSLFGRSGPSSVLKASNAMSSLNRPESAQSLRKDTSLSNASRGSSSIPISTPRMVPNRSNISPVPRAKRDTLTAKVRNMDSLSRIHISPNHSPASTTNGSPSVGNTPIHSARGYITPSSNGSPRKSNSANGSPRRSNSNTSVGSKGIDLSTTIEPVEKVQPLRKLWNMLKI